MISQQRKLDLADEQFKIDFLSFHDLCVFNLNSSARCQTTGWMGKRAIDVYGFPSLAQDCISFGQSAEQK